MTYRLLRTKLYLGEDSRQESRDRDVEGRDAKPAQAIPLPTLRTLPL